MKAACLLTVLFATTLAGAQTSAWEKEVVYQIFPRSFYDSNSDHNGDLNGIKQKLGFLHNLGITAILINPIFASQLYHNYFADDFMKVDPTLGTNGDFFDLVKAAHAKKIKVILDVEVQYVADKHPWFKAFKSDPKSALGATVWMNGSALFGPVIPTYDKKNIGYATLDPNNDTVKKTIEKVFQYWAAPDGNPAHGVDGFRIDHMMDDLDFQHKKTGMLKNFWLPIETSARKLNPKALFLAEQSDWGLGADVFQKAKVDAAYAIPLHAAWITFDKRKIEKALNDEQSTTPNGKTQFLFVENHDVERYASVVNGDAPLLRLGAVFNLTVKGTPLIYYGQELGMKGIQGKWNTDGNDIPVRLAYRWARKVESKGAANFYRNSGPWDRTGFARDNDGISVEEEQASEDSLLNFYKRLIQLRAKTPALQTGSFRLLETKNLKVLGFERSLGKQKVDILLNLSAEPQSCPIALSHAKLISPESARTQTGASLTLKPHGYAILSQN